VKDFGDLVEKARKYGWKREGIVLVSFNVTSLSTKDPIKWKHGRRCQETRGTGGCGKENCMLPQRDCYLCSTSTFFM